MLVAGAVLAGIAALIHVLIFVLESITWSVPRTWRRFGVTSQADAEVIRPMAFNQGFYNLFLAIGALVGIVLLATPVAQAGFAVTAFATASMLAAALVLVLSSPRLGRAAATQGAAPLVALILLVASVLVPAG
ncbi:MAG: DUF1304 domain-containing protein [Micrococcales bacterium]|nr:DUF1304 domain-containing protein [Micrococcales bacterium]